MPAPATEMQKKFAVEFVANGGNATAAAKVAGYSERSAYETGRKTLNAPVVAELIHRALNRAKARSGVIGLNALIEICEDKKTPANTRVSAAKALCEHAGLIGTGKVSDESFAEVLERNKGEISPKEVLRAFMRPEVIEAELVL